MRSHFASFVLPGDLFNRPKRFMSVLSTRWFHCSMLHQSVQQVHNTSLHIACCVHSLAGGYPIPAMEVSLQKDLSRRANQKLPWKRNIHWSQLPLWKLFPKVLVLGTHRSFEKGLADFDDFSSWSRNAKPSWRSSDYVRNLLHSGSLLQAHQW